MGNSAETHGRRAANRSSSPPSMNRPTGWDHFSNGQRARHGHRAGRRPACVVPRCERQRRDRAEGGRGAARRLPGRFRTHFMPFRWGATRRTGRERIRVAAPAIEVPYAPVSPDPSVNRDASSPAWNGSCWPSPRPTPGCRRAYDAAGASEGDIVIVDEPELRTHPVQQRHRAAESLAMAAIDPGVSRWSARGGASRPASAAAPRTSSLLVAQAPGPILRPVRGAVGLRRRPGGALQLGAAGRE